MRRINLTILVVLLLAGCQRLQAQEIRVLATIDKNKILIGEHIILQLDVEVPANSGVGWFNLDTIPHFQFIQRNKIDTQLQISSMRFKQMHTITSFDSGRWVIPQMAITVGNNRYLTDSIQVQVDYSEMDPNQPYHGIKDILEVPEEDTMFINYVIAVVTLIALAILCWILWRKRAAKKEAAIPAPNRLTAIDQALKDLETLKAENLPEKGEAKTYFIRLNDIIRVYFRNRGLVTSPDAENEKLVLRIQSDLTREQVVDLAQTLRMADAVKFARYIPPVADQEQSLERIKKSISMIEEIHYKNPAS